MSGSRPRCRLWGEPSNDLTRFFERDATRPPSVWRDLLHLMLLPLYLLKMAVFVTAGLVEAGLVAPALAAVGRSRRYLADAAAVALTRNPTQLARALRNVAGSLGARTGHPPAEQRIKRLAAQGAVLAWEPRASSHRSRLSVLEFAGAIGVVPRMATMA